MEIPRRQPRTATLWTLAACIIIADQLSKAWFVFRLGNLHGVKTFGEFLPRYFSEFNATLNREYSIIEHKYYSHLLAEDINVLGDWIRFYLTTNKGAAWSMFHGHSLILSFVSLAIATLLWFVWRRNFASHRAMTVAIAAIIGGALGNFIDRFRLQEVVDFVAVRIPYIGRVFPSLGDPYDFPIFNVADASAVCGTIALASYLLWLDLTAGKRKRRKEEEARRHQPFRGGIQLDEEALDNLRRLDTKRVPRWEPGMNALSEEQEEVTRERAQEMVEADLAAQVPALTADYQPTASALEVAKQEQEDGEDDVIT
jgi:signal peptidase II